MHRTTYRTPRPTTRAMGLALLVALLGACSDTPDDAVPAADETPADDAVVEVRMSDYGFAGLPDTVAADTRLTVVNESEEELHEVVAFPLPDEEERDISELTQLAPDELTEALGEPVTVLLAAPGGDPIPAVGDGTLSEPGRYALMCFIPTGADVQEYLEAAADPDQEGPPQVEGGPPHFVHGMYAELTVE